MVSGKAWLASLLLLATAGVLRAAPVRVAVMESEPFVISENGVWSGMSVDVWQKVAELNSWQYVIKDYPSPEAIFAAMKNNEIDIVVANVPITTDGLQYGDFSQPYFRSGLQVMVNLARKHTLARLYEDLGSWEHVRMLWVIAAVVIVLTVAVTLFERRHNPDFPKRWHEGLAEAFYYVISLTLTGKSVYKGFPGVLGRLMLVVWTIFGVITVIYITSSVTAAMTAEKLQGQINGPADLPGRVIGAVKDTRAIGYLGRHGIETNVYPTLEEAVKALLQGDVRAVVDAAPILQYFDNNHPELPITEVGPVFAPYNYGFALPEGSPFRPSVNAALLRLQESGVLMDIGRKYFGTVYQP